MEDRESKGDVQDDTSETRNDSHVETFDALLLPDLWEAIHEAVVLMGIDSLHLSLDNVNRVVGHGGAESSERTWKEIDDNLDWDNVTKLLLGILKHDESYTLIWWLFHKGGYNSFITSTQSLLLDNGVDSME